MRLGLLSLGLELPFEKTNLDQVIGPLFGSISLGGVGGRKPQVQEPETLSGLS